MKLKPKKCKIIPLRCHDLEGPANLDRYRAAVARIVPEWKDFSVEGHAVYLGYTLGPTASRDDMWRAATTKMACRAKEVASAGLAPSAGLTYFQTYVAPTTVYTSMLVGPGKMAQHAAYVAVQRLLHLPYRALPQSAVAHLGAIGLPPIRDFQAACDGQRARMAERMAAECDASAALLEDARAFVRVLAALVDPRAEADRVLWAGPAFADELQGTQNGGGEPPAERAGGGEGVSSGSLGFPDRALDVRLPHSGGVPGCSASRCH